MTDQREAGARFATGPGARRRRMLAGAATLCAALLLIALGASSAFAGRTFSSKITSASTYGVFSLAFENNNDLWFTDGGEFGHPPGVGGIYKYGAYPSTARLGQVNTFSVWTPGVYLWLTAAIDEQTGEVFVAQTNGREVSIFAPSSPSNPCKEEEPVCYTHSWTRINSANSCFNCTPDIHIAIDNTNTFSRGRVYLALASPEDDVEVVDAAQRPVDFPATTSYIENNKLLGTPSGPFGQVEMITVDDEGNLYVDDAEKHVIDEFDSTGTFVRSFPAPRAERGLPGVGGAGVDPTNGNVLISEGYFNSENGEGGVREFDSSGNYLQTISHGESPTESFQPGAAPAINSNGYAYVPAGNIDIYGPADVVPTVTYKTVSNPTPTSGVVSATVDPNGGGNVTSCKFEYGTTASYGNTLNCSPDPNSGPPASNFSSPTDVSAALTSLTTDTPYHYRVVVHNTNGVKYGADQVYSPHRVLGLATEAATVLAEREATLNASFVGNGEGTHYYFEWGPTVAYGQATASPPGASAGSPSGPSRTPLEATLSELTPYTTYHYRVAAVNGGGTSYGEDRKFTTTPGIPSVVGGSATVVHADRAILHGLVNPNGADTQAHLEYVTDAEFQESGFADATRTPDIGIGMSKHNQTFSASVTGLQAGTIYHYRAVGDNAAGDGVPSFDRTFKTFAFEREVNDTCPNAHIRQQTGTALLLDCRAYELVSAANSGGYDVESALVLGQTPFGDYPEAENPSQVLYGVHDGGIPGTGNPTNRGVDPYVATRGEHGWTTGYVGIPADAAPSAPFSSTVAEADASLDTFAFGGPEICSPCFSDGSTGEPLRTSNGDLVQGMAGSLNPGSAAEPAGFIGRHLSADGSHFIFGSSSKFEPDGNSNGDVSIYDRNLASGVTHVVSKTPAGATMTGPGIGELDISKEGSRIVVGQLVSEEEGAKRWNLYMNVADSNHTVDLTPATTSGALYDGMTADGSAVFFTTVDRLVAEDEDESADLYKAEVGPGGNLELSVISIGSAGTGNSDSCDPAANSVHEFHWNTTGTEANCGVVAVGGGGGVSRVDGTVFFLSPEQLDGSGHGVADAPNLYEVRRGSAPHFVATLESSANAPLPPKEHPFVRSFGAFENPTGVAIDHATGDVYVLDVLTDVGQGFVYKFDSSGHPVLGFGTNGKIAVGGQIGFYNWSTEMAVDNDPGSSSFGDIYITEIGHEGAPSAVKKYSSSGAFISKLAAPFPEFGPTGVAVDAGTGNVYVATYFGGFGMCGSSVQYCGMRIFNPEGEEIQHFETEFSRETEGVAVDPSNGNAYVVNGGGPAASKGTTEVYDYSGNHLFQLDANPSYGVAVDLTDRHVYVDEGKRVSEFDPAGNKVGGPIGAGLLGGSVSLAADSGTVDISNPGKTNIASFGQAVRPADPETDNPLVVDSVSSPGARRTGEFQVTPSGNDAAFTSTLPLSGYDTALIHREVFRYDAPSDRLECASCNPTQEQATGEAALPGNGLGLSDDGRVFFDSGEGLVDRDLNNREDAYQWEPDGFRFGNGAPPCETEGGCIQLISAGTSPFASSLLGISADGTDAYFFTRDKLAEEDENGNSVKVYDARSLGGFAFVPPEPQCKASDECHGPGTTTPPAPNIKSVGRTPGGNVPGTRQCKSGQVMKHGKCVRKRRRKIRHHHRGHRHG